MDWSAVRFDWNLARAFLIAAEEGSLAAAAQALDQQPSALAQQLAELEQAFDVQLLERIGRKLRLTAAGTELLVHVRSMGEAANRVALAAASPPASVEAQVCISASEVICAFILPRLLAQLRQAQPTLNLTLVASSAAQSADQEPVDLAIRSSKPSEPNSIARRLRDTPARLYATPAYLRSIGNPESVEDLSRAAFIGFRKDDRLLAGLQALGFPLTPQNFPMHTENHLVLWQLVKNGLGIGIIIDAVGDAEPSVQRVLPDLPPIPVPAWLVATPDLGAREHVRVVFDLLVAELGTPRKLATRAPRKAAAGSPRQAAARAPRAKPRKR